jgi:transcriptional regulator with XRE-family HTH domain
MASEENLKRVTPHLLLARRLRQAREAQGISLRALAEKIGYPHGYLGRVERGEQLPSDVLAEALDTYFQTSELFLDLLEMARFTPIPNYATTLLGSEGKATRIQNLTSSLVPGLLQTEAYMRAQFRRAHPRRSAAGIEEMVEFRMRRKCFFAREDQPLYWAVMDEAVLKRPTGGEACMRQQLAHLLKMAQMPQVTLQVLAFEQGHYPLMGGSTSVLTLPNGSSIAYLESAMWGEALESPRAVLACVQRFDVCRAMALPPQESLDVIRTYMEACSDGADS